MLDRKSNMSVVQPNLVVSRLALVINAPWLGRREPRPTSAVPSVAFSTVDAMVVWCSTCVTRIITRTALLGTWMYTT